MRKDTFANSEVLAFYKALPFNLVGSPRVMAELIRGHDAALEYPPLAPLLTSSTRVLDVGCGTGWFSNTIAFHHGCPTTGIDFNPAAIDFGRAVAQELGVDTAFAVEDLFLYRPVRLFDVVISLGVLHHTNDCLAGIRHVCTSFVRRGGHALIGLYHKFGRKPFCSLFAGMKAQGASEQALLDRFRAFFRSQQTDETHLQSWFRDQVLNPHETHHTLREVLPVLEQSSMELVATSLNDFQPIHSLDKILAAEQRLESIAEEKIAGGQFFPGFFVFLAQNRH